LPTRDQLHRVFLEVSLNAVVRKDEDVNVNFVRDIAISKGCVRVYIDALSASLILIYRIKIIMQLHSYFTYGGFVILGAEEVFFLLFRHFFTYASIRWAIFLGLISPVLL